MSTRKSQSFFKKVTSRYTKPYQPTNDNFSITEWQNEFWSSNNPDPREYQLFKSGIWFNECFNEVKSKFNNLPYYKDTKERLIRFQVGAINDYINRQYKYFYEVNNKSLKSSDSSDFVETLEAIIDSLRHILIKINQDENIINSDISLENWLKNSLELSILYDELKHFWMQCLWHKWYVDSESQESIEFITPSDLEKGLQHL